jgi:FkbM family methyltransferase
LANIAADQDSLRATIAADQKRLEHLPTQLARIEAYGYAAARRIAVPCGPDELLVRTLVGYVLCPGSDHALLSSLIEAGELEPGTRGLIQRLLSPGNVFIDVGANIGMHTLAAAIAMGGKGRIVAFEPFAQTHGLLQKTIWMNGFSEIAEVHQAAVSDRQGSQMLFLGATSGHHSLYQLQPAILPVPPPVEVALVRLDDVLRGAAHVDLIKIDVEGAELDVLSGAGLTISNNKDIGLIVEFGFSHLKRSGQLTQDWLGAFERFGLDVGVINSETGVLESWTREQLEAAPSVNLFFARPGSKTWNRAWGTP